MSDLEQMSDLDQLVLIAFDIALEQLDSPLPDSLQAKLNHLRNQPDVSVREFDALAESYAPLKERYEQACLELVRHGGQRKLFLVGNGQPSRDLSQVAQTSVTDSGQVVTDIPDGVMPLNSQTVPEPVSTPRPASTNQTHSIYRFFLPAGATVAERRKFHQDVEWIKQANPNWVVSLDRPLPNEADAIVLIYNDENYLAYHAGYIATRTLSEFSHRVFGN